MHHYLSCPSLPHHHIICHSGSARARLLLRAPGAVVNEEEIVILDSSFFPLNLDPQGGKHASLSDSEWGPYLLHISSLIIFLPHHRRHHSLSKRWARSCMVLEIVNAVPRRHRRVSLVCPHRASCFRPKPQSWIPLLTMSVTGHRQQEQASSPM